MNEAARFFSPSYLGAASFLVAMIAFFLPSQIYFNLVGERYIYGSVITPVFLLLESCLLYFMGVYISKKNGGRVAEYSIAPNLESFFYFLSLLLVFVNIIFSIKAYQLYAGNFYSEIVAGVDGAALAARREVQELKSDLSISYILNLNYIVYPLYSLIKKNKFTKFLISVWFLSSALSFLFTQSSGTLISLFFVVGLVYLASSGKRLGVRGYIIVLVLPISFLFYFSLVQSSRSGFDGGGAFLSFIEYFAGSLNRYAALVESEIVVPGMYKLGYIIQPLKDFPIFGGMFISPIFEAVFGDVPPNGYYERTRFISAAGLVSHLTSFSAFGQLFIDLWVFFPIVFFWMGYFFQRVWVGFLGGRPSSVILYPILAWSIVEWRGYLELSRPINGVIYLLVIWVHFSEKRKSG